MTDFLLKSTISLGLFLLFYYLILQGEKMHVFNRFYLLFAVLFSLVLPIISFPSYHRSIGNVPVQNIITILPEIAITNGAIHNNFLLLYIAITALLSIRFITNLAKIGITILKYPKFPYRNARLVLVPHQVLPHTFMNFIFLNRTDFEQKNIESELFTHELVHVTQKHSIDVLIIEIIKTLLWFNPLLYLYKKSMLLNHEFLADEKVITEFKDVKTYQQLLLQKAAVTTTFSLASNLNFLITKRRLIMMTKTTSARRANVKKLIAIPLFAIVVVFIGTESATSQTTPQKKTSAVVTAIPSNETAPEFPGGLPAFYKFFFENYKIPAGFASNEKLLIGFTITKDGSLANYKIVKDLGSGTAEEAIRVLKLSPKWKPGSKDGAAADVEFYLPIALQPKK